MGKMLLEAFHYTIEHRSNTRMRHVYALSRYPAMTMEADSVIQEHCKYR